MKRWIALILLVGLLTGCTQTQVPPATVPTAAPTTTAEPTVPPTTLPQLEFSASHCNFGEAYGQTYDSKRSYTATYNDVVYHFASSIGKEVRPEMVM